MVAIAKASARVVPLGRSHHRIEDRKRWVLARSPLFARLDVHTRSRVATAAHLVFVEPRRPLCSPDDTGLYVVGSGRLRRMRTTADRELTFGYIEVGDVVGEERLADPHVTLETMTLERVEALRIPGKTVRDLLESDACFAFEMQRLVGERRLALEERLHGLLCRSVESRVAEFVLGAAQRHGVADGRGVLVSVKFTHQEIANFVGATRETVTVVIGALKRAGLIDTDRRRLVVLNELGLRARI